MEDSTLPFWIYLGFLFFVGGALQRLLSRLGAAALLAWLGAALLLERLWPVWTLLAAGLLLARRARPHAALPPHGKAVLITGCDSGFGNVTAKHLDSLGFEVFATVLDLTGPGARDLQRTCSSRLSLLQVDITQPQQVQQALLDIKAKLGLRAAVSIIQTWFCFHQITAECPQGGRVL